jgi:hypothetical protein
MAIDLYTKRVPASEALSIVPPATPVLVPGRAEDIAKLEQAKSNYELWRTHLSGPVRSRQEEKWYRSLVDVVAEGVGMHPDTLHCELKYRAGKILKVVDSPLLGPQVVLKSSVQMDNDEFHTYVLLATEILFLKYLPGVRRRDVLAEVYRRTGVRPPK